MRKSIYKYNRKVESGEHITAKERLCRWLNSYGNCQAIMEYPFSINGGGIKSWIDGPFKRKPTKRQLWARGMGAIYIADIAVIEDGVVTTVLEVVKTSPTKDHKIKWLTERGVDVYEADYADILANKKRPENLDDILRLVR